MTGAAPVRPTRKPAPPRDRPAYRAVPPGSTRQPLRTAAGVAGVGGQTVGGAPAASSALGVWALWVATVGVAVTVGSWNSVAMLGAMAWVPLAQAGRSSGRVMVGFLGALGVTPPLFGAAVDRTGSFPWCWAVPECTCALALVAMIVWSRQPRTPA